MKNDDYFKKKERWGKTIHGFTISFLVLILPIFWLVVAKKWKNFE